MKGRPMDAANDQVIEIMIEACARHHLPDLAQMCAELWPDESVAEHLESMTLALGGTGEAVAFLARDANEQLMGFAEASVRRDYVNGCDTSPVGFLEGLYVRDAFRRRGIARGLVAAVEIWARDQGCLELASDAMLANEASHAAHQAIGFDETERVIFFRKSLEEPIRQ